MQIILSQRILEAIAATAKPLRPFGIVPLPENGTAVTFGLDDQQAGARERNMIDLRQTAATVGDDDIVEHLAESSIERARNASLTIGTAPPREQPNLERRRRQDGHACPD
nr:hypothetical protein [Thioflavicoccus mobilis]